MIKILRKIDFLLLLPPLLLSCLGLLMIYSISYESDPTFFLRQAVYLVISVGFYLIISRMDFKNLIHLSYVFLVLVFVLLLATFFIGVETFGSTRWIDLGLVTVQGSELAKPALLLALAAFFSKHSPEKLKNILISLLLVLPIFILVFEQPDLGSSFIILSIWAFLIFIAGVDVIFAVGAPLLLALLSPIAWHFLEGYQKARLLSFINPEADPQGQSYNLVQALIAFGSGQFLGRGLGRGTQSHLDFLPAGKTDFIMAATGEELGFIGIALIIILFAFLIYKLLKVARSQKDFEASLFIYGAAFVLFLQFFVNAGMNMGILPITGITLPFISFGGSSLVASFIILGLVQSIVNYQKS